MVLNFPNNPTGYTPLPAEADEIVKTIKAQAETGTKIVVVSDDAYFSLFFEDSIKESIFTRFCDLHENILAVKLDGATKRVTPGDFEPVLLHSGIKQMIRKVSIMLWK